ncbi:hypothetical protein RHSIM_Rhsim08G0203300 [Rhododendron simsii]|uniref:Cytochrome c-type biogenesis protein n=1 Tax=Rhododendron simsii TaxID=118357 RepID=A0A834LGU9_RHOSS|nr:hypothetical protein RHSIM_Rhsim08G0203300 [Rhododendron simsii]
MSNAGWSTRYMSNSTMQHPHYKLLQFANVTHYERKEPEFTIRPASSPPPPRSKGIAAGRLTKSASLSSLKRHSLIAAGQPVHHRLLDPKLIYDDIPAGKSDKDIYKKVEDDFEETVLYAPKFDLQTAALWLSPVLLEEYGLTSSIAAKAKS